MTFVLRTITRRAGGGDIVRDRPLMGDQIRIGRGTDCDIRIQDLAVSLHHATLTADGHGRARIETTGDTPFGIDGKFVRQATLVAAQAPVLTFGDHRLAVEAGEDETILLTLTRPETGTRAGAGSSDAAGGFAARRRLLGKRGLAWVGVVGIGLLCLALPILAMTGGFDRWLHPRIDPDAQWSSGPLSQSHAFLENDCQSCHQQAFVSVTDASCTTCHAAGQPPALLQRTNAEVRGSGSPDEPSRVADHAGLRRLIDGTPPAGDWGGRVVALARKTFNRPEQRCATCHVEHVGNPLTDRPLPRPTLQTAQTCVACHADLDRRLRDTDLKNAPDWPHHPEMRPRITVAPGPGDPTIRRVSLADRPRETSGLDFPHRLHLSDTGSVARMARTLGPARGYGAALDCKSCHVAEPNEGNFRPVNMETACSTCHSLAFATPTGVRNLPHGEPVRVVSFLRGAYARGGPVSGAAAPGPRARPGQAIDARRQVRNTAGLGAAAIAQRMRGVFSPGGACYDCHTAIPSAATGFAVAPVHVTDAYLSRGAFNHRIEAHRQDDDGQPNCARCHAAATSDEATDLLLPRLSECADCHGEAVRAPTVVPAAADCSTCHSYHAPARPTPREPTRRAVAAITTAALGSRRPTS